MTSNDKKPQDLFSALKERAKELNCLYQAEEILMSDDSIEERLKRLVELIPQGFLKPESCQASIEYLDQVFCTDGFKPSATGLLQEIKVQGTAIGLLKVSYPTAPPDLEGGHFLEEEQRFLKTLSQRVGQAIFQDSLNRVFSSEGSPTESPGGREEGWLAVMEMLRITDQELYSRLFRRMLNHLCYIGDKPSRDLLESLSGMSQGEGAPDDHSGVNQPLSVHSQSPFNDAAIKKIVERVKVRIPDEIIKRLLQKWIAESRLSGFIDILDDQGRSLKQISDAISQYENLIGELNGLSPATLNAVHVSLIRRFFSRRLEFIALAKNLVSLDDFHELTQHMIFHSGSHGHLGGKSSGLFLAIRIIRKASARVDGLEGIKQPKTWYVASDGILDFMHHNQLKELFEYRYRDIDQIRLEYPNLVALFKRSDFSPEMTRGLSAALDDFGDVPVIVRSSSLLEDSAGSAFSGKHKSLFLANQGTKQERLKALLDAVAEVYASMFGPDPIEYRSERGLLDFQEEMGLLIQEVVGERVGPYFLPAYSGVAFSRNEFRWSPRIRREDGLVRLVPGLGTRAVDRLSNDYPVLIAPGQPGLRVNANVDERIRYAPRFIDLLNLETRRIETIPIEGLIKQYGADYPCLGKVFSTYNKGFLARVTKVTDTEKEFLVPCFDGLLNDTDFIHRMRTMLDVLERYYGKPIDIEFTADGKDLYLLQCRVQSSWDNDEDAALPVDLDKEKVLFTAEKHVSGGEVSDISHLVYVDPDGYEALGSHEKLKDVGRIIGRLNRLLPKRRFILMGPGRWGSRGDIRLGVSVTYSDINNTALLIEVAFRKGDYVPDLSFGTHFFQDLVEANIRYLPLYPDDRGVVFRRDLFDTLPNRLCDYLPNATHLKDVVRVFDLSADFGERLRIVMNGEEGKAIGYLSATEFGKSRAPVVKRRQHTETAAEEHWLWRQKMAEVIASSLNPNRFGVVAMYLFGSTKNGSAGPASDIDLLIHSRGDADRQRELDAWLDGWSRCLGEMNYLKTGLRVERLLDIHIITDDDIERGSSWAMKIGAPSDAARPLALESATE